jgi:hypothetical protein
MDDDLFFRDLVKDKEGIGRHRQAADRGIRRPNADIWVCREQIDDVLNSALNAFSALR